MSNETSRSEKLLARQLKEHKFPFDASAYADFEAMLESELVVGGNGQNGPSVRKAYWLVLGIGLPLLLLFGIFFWPVNPGTSEVPPLLPQQSSPQKTSTSNHSPNIGAPTDFGVAATSFSPTVKEIFPEPEYTSETTLYTPPETPLTETPGPEASLQVATRKPTYLPTSISYLPIRPLERGQPTYSLPPITLPTGLRTKRDRSTLFPDIIKNDEH